VSRTLVIGYGNTLRGDDAAGAAAAALLAPQADGCDVLTLQAPGPELAETLTHYETIIFLDASAVAETVTVRDLSGPAGLPGNNSHALNPGALVTMCRQLYETSPRQCWLVEIPASDFSLREGLSDGTAAAVREAARTALSLSRICSV
jgi:hydrogenase maturation protease